MTLTFDQQKLVGLCFSPSGECHSHLHLRCVAVMRTGRTDKDVTVRHRLPLTLTMNYESSPVHPRVHEQQVLQNLVKEHASNTALRLDFLEIHR